MESTADALDQMFTSFSESSHSSTTLSSKEDYSTELPSLNKLPSTESVWIATTKERNPTTEHHQINHSTPYKHATIVPNPSLFTKANLKQRPVKSGFFDSTAHRNSTEETLVFSDFFDLGSDDDKEIDEDGLDDITQTHPLPQNNDDDNDQLADIFQSALKLSSLSSLEQPKLVHLSDLDVCKDYNPLDSFQTEPLDLSPTCIPETKGHLDDVHEFLESMGLLRDVDDRRDDVGGLSGVLDENMRHGHLEATAFASAFEQDTLMSGLMHGMSRADSGVSGEVLGSMEASTISPQTDTESEMDENSGLKEYHAIPKSSFDENHLLDGLLGSLSSGSIEEIDVENYELKDADDAFTTLLNEHLVGIKSGIVKESTNQFHFQHNFDT
ncbi:hypothetical protein HDU99_005582 [Rhizoclosmatium hyalinum]|nr:hypothetical protein HDU99_005582 [Rhizoclosmatium hyalinum]